MKLKPMAEAPKDGTLILILCDDGKIYPGAWEGEVYQSFSIIKGFGVEHDSHGFPDSAVNFSSVWVFGEKIEFKRPIAKAWAAMPQIEDFTPCT